MVTVRKVAVRSDHAASNDVYGVLLNLYSVIERAIRHTLFGKEPRRLRRGYVGKSLGSNIPGLSDRTFFNF